MRTSPTATGTSPYPEALALSSTTGSGSTRDSCDSVPLLMHSLELADSRDILRPIVRSQIGQRPTPTDSSSADMGLPSPTPAHHLLPPTVHAATWLQRFRDVQSPPAESRSDPRETDPREMGPREPDPQEPDPQESDPEELDPREPKRRRLNPRGKS